MKNLLLTILMLLPLLAEAQEPYAVLSNNNTVLTFYYDNLKSSRNGMSVGPFTDRKERGWDGVRSTIKTIVFDDSFANKKDLTSTAYWFKYMNSYTTIIGLENLNTDNVTDMSHMFEESGFVSLDLSHFNTENVENMREMFHDCWLLKNLDLSSFNTEKVKNMSGMFGGDTNFLEIIDISSFNTSNVTDMRDMFSNSKSLKTIYVSDTWSTDNVSTENSERMFDRCPNLVGGSGTVYDANHTDYTYAHIDGGTAYPGYLTSKSGTVSKVEAYAALSSDNTTLTFYYDNRKEIRGGLAIKPFENASERGWHRQAGMIASVVFDNTFTNCTVTSTAYWFSGFSQLATITGMDKLNTTTVTNMSGMFEGCSALTTISVGEDWTTEAVTSSNNMFAYCTQLVGGDGTVFNPKYTDKTKAYVGSGSYLTAISGEEDDKPYTLHKKGDVFTASTVEGTILKFWVVDIEKRECHIGANDAKNAIVSLASNILTIPSKVDGLRVTRIGPNAFNRSSVTSVTIPTTIATIGEGAFEDCSQLESIVIPRSVAKLESSFSGCEKLSKLTIDNGVEEVKLCFKGCKNLKELFIPASVTKISPKSTVTGYFSSYPLESIVVAEGNTVYDSRKDCNAVIETASNTLLFGCSNSVFLDDIVHIGAYAFESVSLTCAQN